MRKLSLLLMLVASAAWAQTNNSNNPTWWEKYQFIQNNGPIAGGGATASVTDGSDVDVSNECGPQSETYITVNTATPRPSAPGGADPSLAFDTRGNVDYSYIVVYFSNGNGINGTSMAVARSGDGGKTYPFANFFSFSSGSDHFNDKPMVRSEVNASSPYRDRVYVAWDAASGGR